MTPLFEALQGASAPDRTTYRPHFFRLAKADDQVRLEELLKRDPHLDVHDDLHDQITELVRALNPSVEFGAAELDQAATEHLAGVPAHAYGVWVHYPWNRRLVHLLDEAEFVRVRTDRNRNKITGAEQDVLATKKVGIIGLSVGQSVALTLALERGVGEIRLADFDTLELSNMNRIRSGTHQLGLNKAVLAAREILEIDPFLTVRCFTDGITRENLDAFLTEGGKLDILVEECDSVDVKILARQRAKAHRIAVVMDTNDRGMIDVERFDLEPDRPLLHGLIDHLDLEDAAKARTTEEKLPFLAPMAGLDNLSPRMKASMIEVGHSIRTWPQLATSTVLGGALTGDVCRRIALDQFTDSGRWYVDMEALIGGDGSNTAPPAPVWTSIDTDSHVQEAVANTSAPTFNTTTNGGLEEEDGLAMAEAGAMAPSADNMQPWRFEFQDGWLLLRHDTSRSGSVLDPTKLIPHIGLGMCLENMRLRAVERSIPVELELMPDQGDLTVIATFRRSEHPDAMTRGEDPLAVQIPKRHTNRKDGDGRPLSAEQLRSLVDAVSVVPNARVHLLTEPEAIAELAVIQGAADRLRIMNEHGHREFFQHQLRWTTEEAERTRDGLDIATLELSAAGRVGMRMAAAPKAIRTLAAMGGGHALEKLSADAVRTSSAVALLTMPDLDPHARIEGGRAAQRLWLQATGLGLAVHPLSAPIFLGQHAQENVGRGLSVPERKEALDLFARLKMLFDCDPEEPFFMVRLSFAPPPTTRALRRSIDSMFHIPSAITT